MPEQRTFAHYQAQHGVITKDGHTMMNEDIAKELNRKSALEQENAIVSASYNAALAFALDQLPSDQALHFLGLWREGCWPEIAEEHPEFDLSTTGQCDRNGSLLSSTNEVSDELDP